MNKFAETKILLYQRKDLRSELGYDALESECSTVRSKGLREYTLVSERRRKTENGKPRRSASGGGDTLPARFETL